MTDDPKPTPDEIKAAARRLGVTTASIYRRHSHGMTWQQALTAPKMGIRQSARMGKRIGGWGDDFLLPGSVPYRRMGGRG